MSDTQKSVISLDDLTPYIGKWVLLRDQRVIAHADDPTDLRHPTLDEELMLVPRPGIYI